MRLHTFREIAELLGITERTVRSWQQAAPRRSATLQVVRDGTKKRVTEEHLATFLALTGRCVPLPEPKFSE